LDMHLSGFTLNETTGGYPGNDVMICVRVGHFGNDMLKRALDAGYFKRGGIPFHKVDGKVKWRKAERQVLREVRQQCRDQLKHLQNFEKTGIHRQLGDDFTAKLIKRQLKRDVRLLNGCIEAFNEELGTTSDGPKDDDDDE